MHAQRLVPGDGEGLKSGVFSKGRSLVVIGRVTRVPGEPVCVNGVDLSRTIAERDAEITQQLETAGGESVVVDGGLWRVTIEHLGA